MSALYQKFFIAFILLTVFTGRMVIHALPPQKTNQELTKDHTTDPTEKSESSEKQNQLTEKDKHTDLLLSGLNHIYFVNLHNQDKSQISGIFTLVNCHLQIPEQPPK